MSSSNPLRAHRGRFITIEGVDGAGKSSHLEALSDLLRSYGFEVVLTREPGGTPLGEKLRALLLHEPMDLVTETLLMFASRNELMQQVILPALQRGAWVLCDRHTDATVAYQGGGRELGVDRVRALEDWWSPSTQPDLTLWFDLSVDQARQRLGQGREMLDRFEQEGTAFFTRVRAAYQALLTEQPHRIRRIDSAACLADVRQQACGELKKFIEINLVNH